jgi:Cu-Zn family superoxide dismutase
MLRTILAFSLAGLAAAPLAAADTSTAPFAGATGSVTLTAAPKGVLVHIEASGLTPGWHAIHFHEKATCGDPGFKASGAHVHGATALVHGLLNPAASDDGDLPNIYAGADGKANAEVFTSLVSLRSGGAGPALLDADGSALVIHANKDDYQTQPIGGAGDRIACAVLK